MDTFRSTRSREAGQAIIIIVFAFVGLLAFVGISVDLGRYLVAQAQLRRAVDAAALAGAAQFRLSSSNPDPAAVYDKVNQAARAMLRAHNVSTDTLASGVTVSTTFNTPSMVTIPPTKKVRVTAQTELPLIFLSLVGWRAVPLSTDATSEAASVDVALVIDISDSMSADTMAAEGSAVGDYPREYACNEAFTCEPFEKVRAAARDFLTQLSPGYDRVTVIPFAFQAGSCYQDGDVWPYCVVSAYNPVSNPGGTYLPLPWEQTKIDSNLADADAFIAQLKMDIPDWAGNPPTVPFMFAPRYQAPDWDPRLFVNTNLGGGIRAATTELLKEFNSDYASLGWGPNHRSRERLRVIVLLTDGATNASGLGAESYPTYGTDLALGYCPRSTWDPYPPDVPFCRAPWPVLMGAGRHISTSVEYDAVDYALDWADFAMLEPPPNGTGNGIVVFTIGLGKQVVQAAYGDPLIGEKVLRYIAAGGDDGKLSSDLCAPVASGQSCGNYYFAPTGDDLLKIFQAIAGRIFTRINQ